MAYSYPWVENGGVNAPSSRSLRDYIQANKVRAQEPSSMSLREYIRNNGQMDPMTPVYNPGWPTQHNFVREYEETFSPHHLAPYQSYQPPFEHFNNQPSFNQTQSSSLHYHIQAHDAYLTPPNNPLEDTIEDTLEDTLALVMESQEEVNSKVDKALDQQEETLNDIKSQLTLLMQTLVVQAEDESLIPSPSILTRQVLLHEPTPNPTLHHEQVHPITNLRNEDIIEQTIFPQDFESKEEDPKVSEEIFEDEIRDDEPEREEPMIEAPRQNKSDEEGNEGPSKRKEELEIEDSKQEEKSEDFGLSNVGDAYVKKDDIGLEVIPIISIGHVIYTFPPLAPSPTSSAPLELHAPTLEPIILHIADQQKEGEGQLLHSMRFIGTFVHDHFTFSTFHDPFYPCMLSCYIIEFIKGISIFYLFACLNSLKFLRIDVWDDGKFPLCGIG